MPEYLTPGVYLEEFEMGARPIEGVSTSTAGFLGETERGPTIPPKLVTSLTQFSRIFGGYIENSNLTYAVDGFFANGGQRCYIGRFFPEGSTLAKLKMDSVIFEAVGEGSWGRRIGVGIENASSDPDNDKNPDGQKVFKLTVAYWKPEKMPSSDELKKPDDATERKLALVRLLEKTDIFEVFDELSEDKNSPNYYIKKLSDPLTNISNLILINKESSGRPNNTENFFVFLTEEGVDGEKLTRDDIRGKPEANPGERRGLAAFTEIDDISIVHIPYIPNVDDDFNKTINEDVFIHCETLKDRFAIIDVKDGIKEIGSFTIPSFTMPRVSKYGALYYPWIKVYDPLTKKPINKPPGGYIAGIYARSDIERGVHKAPANELVRGAVGLEFQITKEEQGILNPRGINVIRSFPGRGILVWGARACIVDPLWKYINVRRLFIYVEKSIERGTQWVVFEPNNERLWARVKATITQFLTGVWRDGALMGTKPEEAFFVKCDRTTMTQDDIDNGRLICIIGIAPTKPAEFVIFRIAQWAGGSAATE